MKELFEYIKNLKMLLNSKEMFPFYGWLGLLAHYIETVIRVHTYK